MFDLIDRDLESRIARLQEKVNQLCSYNDAIYDAARIIDNTPPVTSEIVCNSGDTIAISKIPANIVTYSRSFHDLVQELHNCPNCGGSVDGEGMCKYCGSRVYRFGGI